ncbi:FAD-dependent oxidoreductase [uncultured Clostridium sp.]|uniref:FAD-dependent oxidoreductase n=1 Tax=uncultured Clostridium sp. TaxID=59620 RepID=UPI0028EB1AA7|nr:FAD-dependent oxidoreductase [uncultured Clostridium sp.]
MKVVVIGGVAGGAGVCARLRRNREDLEIIMIEKGDFISYANCGLPYYIGNVIENQEELLLQTPEGFGKRFNVEVRVRNEVLSVDTDKKEVTVLNHKSGESYVESYDVLVLSPGAKPIVPNLKRIDKDHVYTLRTVPDTLKIKEYINREKPSSAIVVGGGFIGIEMAENLKHLGINVSIIEAADHVIASIDSDMSHEIHNHIRENGVSLYLNSKVVEISDNYVLLEDGREIKGDLVIMSVGVRPETEFLKDSGIKLGGRGEIVVDEFMKTSQSNIYALGDAVAVKSFGSGKENIIPLAGPANKQGRIVADNIASKKVGYNGTQGTAIAKVFDMTTAVTGESERTLKQNGTSYKKVITYSASNATYYPGAQFMTIKLLFTPDTGKILGGQIAGYKGVDKRIDTIASSMRSGLTVHDVQELELAYAPPFSSAKDPLNMAAYVAGNVLDGTMKPFYIEDVENIPKEDIILDVRTEMENEQGRIEGSINIPVDELRDRIDELDKDKKYYIYCRVGQRGYIAQRILEQRGFNTLNLSGGYKFYEQLLLDERNK